MAEVTTMGGSGGRWRRARGATGGLGRAIGPVALLAAIWPGPATASAASPPAICMVARVADGVTLELRCAGETRLERLRGVRAPRPGPPHAGGEPFAAESRREALRWLAGAPIALAGGVARLDGEDVRLGLLARGLVVVEPAAADRAELAALRFAEREARGRG